MCTIQSWQLTPSGTMNPSSSTLALLYDLWKTYYVVNSRSYQSSFASGFAPYHKSNSSSSRQIQNIWTGKWIGVSVIYLMCRYMPFAAILLELLHLFNVRVEADLVPNDVVDPGHPLLTATPMLPHRSGLCFNMALNLWRNCLRALLHRVVPLILRVYALWGTSQPVAIFLSFLTVGLTCGLVLVSFKVTVWGSFPWGTECTRGGDISLMTEIGSLLALSIDAGIDLSIIMGMAIWGIRKKYPALDKSNRLLMKIQRDTITYFCNNFFIAAISVVVCLTRVTQASVPLRIGGVLTSMLASTMILDLKDYGNRTFSFSQDLDAADPMSELSTLRFNDREPSQIDE
ncbi:hypothetical protein P691DRAFT_790321 [Macrolepiota fuliginosa MF-IS2]|uniref:Uncharacterized protein n=1 Tax=Macrolepiota fuliginosa MF-IS2 TaxID=1400762 RepID=A0A9P5WZK2_9AGAR|nr:hypothetical protein P691DRAFT_790321 [Macrolepiota fuliginosa MF-IS2]